MRARIGLILAAILAAQAVTPARAQPSDTAVKAAFLPRFARYVNWPPAAAPKSDEPFVLCVIGSDRFGRTLDNGVTSQNVDGRRIVVRRLDTADSSELCHVAFVQGSRLHSVGQMLGAIGRQPVLTVTDASNGRQRGIIHFAIVGGRVRFFIDQAAAQQRGLNISSRLLALAMGVKQ